MYTLKRYITRIALPIAAVAILVVALRNIMVSRSQELNVGATIPPEAQGLGEHETIPWNELERDAPYSAALKQDLVAKISFAATKLDAAMAQWKESRDAPPEEAVASLQERSEKVQQELSELEKADADNWRERRREAVAALRDYADAIEAQMGGG